MAQGKIIEIAKSEIYRRYPEMRGVEPIVEEHTTPYPILKKPGQPSSEIARGKIYLLTFKKEFKAQDGTNITQIVRVTVDSEGRIIKAIMSR